MNENKNKHNDGEFYDDDGDRYISVEQSIIGACKEVKDIRAGKSKGIPLDEFLTWLDDAVKEEIANGNNSNRAF